MGGPTWQLSQRAFERFLEALDTDRNAAADRYEQLRSKLTRFFEWRRCAFPEEHADETINRVIRKIDEGEDIRDPRTYCYGVARLILFEVMKQQAKEQEAFQDLRRAPTATGDEDDVEQRLRCLRRCLNGLPPEQRDLVRDYYRGDGSERISGRRRLADALGIGMNALRIRAFRLSDKLQGCVIGCVRLTGGA